MLGLLQRFLRDASPPPTCDGLCRSLFPPTLLGVCVSDLGTFGSRFCRSRACPLSITRLWAAFTSAHGLKDVVIFWSWRSQPGTFPLVTM